MNPDEYKPIPKKNKVQAPEARQQAEPDAATRMFAKMDLTNTLLREVLDEIQAQKNRGAPATAKDVEVLTEKVRKGITVTFDSQKVAESLLPPLQGSMQEAASRIERAAHYSAQAWAGRIGFTSSRAAIILLGTCILSVGALTWYAMHQNQTIEENNDKIRRYEIYRDWLDKKYPKIYPAYLKEIEVEKQKKK